MEIIVDYSKSPDMFWYMKNPIHNSIQNVDSSPSRFSAGTGTVPIKQDRFARYRERHRERLKARSRERYYADLEKNREYHRKWQEEARAKNPELIEKIRQWNKQNPEKRRVNQKAYHARHIEARREYENGYRRARRAVDPNTKLRSYIRGRMSKLMRGKIKAGSTLELLGCSIPNLWIYLESKFVEGMTRENYGPVWEVDHIIACANFDLTKSEDQKRCFHFSNLQPMFIGPNRSKGARTQQLTTEK